MSNELLFQLMIPVLSGVFALAFFVLWRCNSRQKYMLALAIGFAACFLGHVVTFFIITESPQQSHKVFSVIGYAFAITTVAWAMHHRASLKTPWLPLLAIACVGVPLAFWAGSTSESLNLKIILTNSTIGIMLCGTALSLRKMVRRSAPEALVVAVLAFIGLQYLFLPQFTLAIDGLITADSYDESTHKLLLDFSKAVSVFLLAVVLFCLCISDLLDWVKNQSQLDHLTGLKNRAAFEVDVDRSFAGDVSVPDLSLILIDIDNFKSINDEFGHPTGDAVIRAFGGLVDRATRAGDVAGRVGGEEFCLMVRGVDENVASEIAERLRVCFSALVIPGLPIGHYVTASFGVATRKDDEDYLSMYKRADEVLYQAKRTGRDRVVSDADISRHHLEESKNRILRASQSINRKQPIVV